MIRFPPIKKGQSVRLRIEETYTDPARYDLIDGQLMWRRSFGRPRNDIVLPAGWYLTASSIPATISQRKTAVSGSRSSTRDRITSTSS